MVATLVPQLSIMIKRNRVFTRCPNCKTRVPDMEFDNDLSLKEFYLSGMCQKCQDETFKSDPEL